jgi:hypothetical protein
MSLTTAQEVHNQVIHDLPPAEQLRLATMILNGIVKQDDGAIYDRDDWSEQDQADILHFSMQYANTQPLE